LSHRLPASRSQDLPTLGCWELNYLAELSMFDRQTFDRCNRRAVDHDRNPCNGPFGSR